MRQTLHIIKTLVVVLIISLYSIPTAFSGDSVCARVKIEIEQEIALERQAFDAHMRITNGLTHVSLENVEIEVSFSDEEGNNVVASSDPDNSDALFFIRIDTMSGIDDVSGGGVVGPDTVADIHWLIIPAQGASDGLEQGTLYYVGAHLIYTIGGEEHITMVSPDYIFVKPMPDLVLDYFIPNDVYGDDPFTSEIEEAVPFSLGVRVSNTGQGTAKSLKIESAQPKIVENEQGLLINFFIQGSEVNGQEETPGLLVDFGDLEPAKAGTARWTMTCSLYGKFVEFSAELTHSDELGGELTSLISAYNTHFLVRDVLVDLPGRDGIRDFLALEGEEYTVYESDNIDTQVTDQSALANMIQIGTNGTQSIYTLTVPVTDGPMVVRLDDPLSGTKEILSAIRSDGKAISMDNVWLYKTRTTDNPWQFYFYLFDVNTPGTYTIVFENSSILAKAPVLQYIPDRQRGEEEQLSFIVEASDPNGSVPSLSTSSLPPGAIFVDNGDGTGLFDWIPIEGQAGSYPVKFTASDGILTDSQTTIIKICPINDSDCDGMDDQWELDNFGSLDRDGTDDYDGDGISDLNEYLNGTDPTGTENAPSVPVINSPEINEIVSLLQPELSVLCSTDADGDILTYEFELFSDAGYTTLVAGESGVPESGSIVLWTVPEELVENKTYYWRARAFDGVAYTLWTHGRFLVSQTNEPPIPFDLLTPKDSMTVDSVRPTLFSGYSNDPEDDSLTYMFSIYSDQALTQQVASGPGEADKETGMVSWQVNEDLTDATLYFWQVTVEDSSQNTESSEIFSFTVQTANHTPSAPEILFPSACSQVETVDPVLTIVSVTDPDGDSVEYDFQIDVSKNFNSENLITSGPDQIIISNEKVQWHLQGLQDDTVYYWRIRSKDSVSTSKWACNRFFVNTYNNSPETPVVKNPGNLSWVDRLTPELSLHPAEEPDNDSIEIIVQLYTDNNLNNLVFEGSSQGSVLTVSNELEDATWYYWRARLVDEHGVPGSWSETKAFFVKENTQNESPNINVYEDAEDGTTSGWDIYANDPEGAIISNVYDALKESRVIEFTGSGTSNGYWLGNDDFSDWNDEQFKVIEWSMCYAEDFVIHVVVQTRDGFRYLKYTTDEIDDLGDGTYIHHGLGSFATDGNWHTLVRDLEYDLKEAQPNNELEAVLGFLIRGSGKVDDIKTIGAIPESLDSDGDDLTDLEEINIYGTHPYHADSDGDALTDEEELNYWDSDWNEDIDGDGKINLLDDDSDDDGYSDGYELVAGSDPGDGFSFPDSFVYEDAEDGTTSGWDIYANDPEGAIISNVYDALKESRVIEFTGSGTSNGYWLGNDDFSDWNDEQFKVIEWSMCYAEDFVIHVAVQTRDGFRYLKYTTDEIDDLGDGTYIHHGLGSLATDGNWHTLVRDLEYDLKEAQPNNELEAVLGFLIRGSGKVDDIKTIGAIPEFLDSDGDDLTDLEEINIYGTHPYHADSDGDALTDEEELNYWDSDWNEDIDGDGKINLLDDDSDDDGYSDGYELVAGSDPGDGFNFPDSFVYEDAEDGTTSGWDIYANDPEGAIISNVYDALKESRVIEFTGSGTSNGYWLGNDDFSDWNDEQFKVIEWSMCYAEDFVIHVVVQTRDGFRYLKYTTDETDDLGDGTYIHHGLGSLATDGNWHTLVRDLEYDLKEAQPNNELEAVLGFLIRGSGKVDDIILK